MPEPPSTTTRNTFIEAVLSSVLPNTTGLALTSNNNLQAARVLISMKTLASDLYLTSHCLPPSNISLAITGSGAPITPTPNISSNNFQDYRNWMNEVSARRIVNIARKINQHGLLEDLGERNRTARTSYMEGLTNSLELCESESILFTDFNPYVRADTPYMEFTVPVGTLRHSDLRINIPPVRLQVQMHGRSWSISAKSTEPGHPSIVAARGCHPHVRPGTGWRPLCLGEAAVHLDEGRASGNLYNICCTLASTLQNYNYRSPWNSLHNFVPPEVPSRAPAPIPFNHDRSTILDTYRHEGADGRTPIPASHLHTSLQSGNRYYFNDIYLRWVQIASENIGNLILYRSYHNSSRFYLKVAEINNAVVFAPACNCYLLQTQTQTTTEGVIVPMDFTHIMCVRAFGDTYRNALDAARRNRTTEDTLGGTRNVPAITITNVTA